MKNPLLHILAISLMALNSCSSVKQNLAQLKEGTTKALGARTSKIKLTKADPSRFLPEGTSVEQVLEKNTSSEPSKPSEKQTLLLAKHTPSSSLPQLSKPSSATPSSSKPNSSKPKTKVVATIPPLELPPLPEASENDNKGFRGILPSLDGSDDATFIDVNGETPELPPMDLPDPESLQEEEDPAPQPA